MQSIIQAVLKFTSLQEQLGPWQNVFEGSGCRRNCFRVAAPGTEPSIKQWKGATDQTLQRELACAHRPNCHTVLETWSCPLPYQSLGSPKKPKGVHAKSAHAQHCRVSSRWQGAWCMQSAHNFIPESFEFSLSRLVAVLAASFWIMCKSSTQEKYTIIHLTECNNMKSQASTSSRHCLPGAWLHRRMFSSFSFRLSS